MFVPHPQKSPAGHFRTRPEKRPAEAVEAVEVDDSDEEEVSGFSRLV